MNRQFSQTERRTTDGRQPMVAPGRGALRRSRLALTVAAALAGGTMLNTCETRLRDAVVAGSKDFLFSVLDPNAIVDALFGDEDAP